MSDPSPYDLQFYAILGLTLVYAKFLYWITSSQQQRWSRSKTITYTLNALFLYIILAIIPFNTLSRPPKSPIERTPLADGSDAEGQIALLYQQIREADFQAETYWRDIHLRNQMTMTLLLLAIYTTAVRLIKRYCPDEADDAPASADA